MNDSDKPRLLVFVVAYNAEKTIQSVLSRIPAGLSEKFHVEILAIDDASRDRTFEIGHGLQITGVHPFPLHVLVNPENQGYGGNQKLGYHFALKNKFDFVALIHGDGQYAPEFLPTLLEPLRTGDADAVFGSRMQTRGAALKGGMPLYKFVGNKILTWIENKFLRTELSEFHSGYRIYSTAALARIPFDRNTNDFHFDTEIIIQFVIAGLKIRELPVPTYYGDEISHVNGMKYAWDVVKAVLKARAQEWGIFYDRKFDCADSAATSAHYALKRGYDSTHRATLNLVEAGSRVLILGSAGVYVGDSLHQERGCAVTAVDGSPLAKDAVLDNFIQHDLDQGPPEVDYDRFDAVLMLDLIEHLAAPEEFADALREKMSRNRNCILVASTANVGFFVTRAMLLLGQFNYGRRGILDMTHRRLLTFASFRRLLEQSGFDVLEMRGMPAPYALVFGDGMLGRSLTAINRMLMRLLAGVFSYQIMIVARPRPTIDSLLASAVGESIKRSEVASR